MEKGKTSLLKLLYMACIFSFFVVEAKAVTCEQEPTDMSVSYGEQVTCGISPAADTDVYRFSANKGDRILAEALFVSGDGFVPRISLVAPDGEELKDTFFPARIDMVLPQTGNYTAIVVDNDARQSGEYAFTVSCTSGNCFSIPPLPPSSGGNITCEVEPTDLIAQLGERVSCEINPSADADLYRFVGKKGDRILAEALFVDGTGFVPRISLIAPNGEELKDTFFPARIDMVLPQTGNYTAIVVDRNARQSGKYAFTVSCTSGSCLGSGNTNIWDIDDSGDVAALSDGLLFLRYLFGFRDDALIQGAISPECKRCSSAEIEAHLQQSQK